MSDRIVFRLFFGFALVLWCAPAAATNQADLVARTTAVMAGLCGTASDPNLAAQSCDVAFGVGAQQTQDALQVSPREQSAASSTATQTTDTQVSAEADRLEQAREEDGASRLGAFLNGSGGFGEVDARGEADEYEVWGGGVQAGVDYRLSDSFVAGFGFGWNRQNSEFDEIAAANGSGFNTGGGEVESDSYTPSLYASFFSGPFHVDGIVTYTYLDYEYDRPIVLLDEAVFLASAKGDTDANQVGFSLSGGYEFAFDALGVGPIAGIDYRQTWIDGYSESQVQAFPLKYDDQDITSLVSSLGAEASYAISTGFGVIVPHLRATWEHEFENDARNIDARLFLNSNPVNDVLISRTDSPDRDYGRLGAGVSAGFAHGISAFIDYDTVLALSDVEHHRFTAGGRIEF